MLELSAKTFGIRIIKVVAYEGKKVNKSLKTERKDLGFTVASYDVMLQELKCFIESNRNFYS